MQRFAMALVFTLPLWLLVACDQPKSGELPAGCVMTRVTRVVDGDTVHALVDGRDQSIRYIGINAPETKKEGSPVEPFGPEASEFNRRLVGGRQVCLERDISELDRYGRLLRYVWLGDGTLVNERLLREGLAVVDTFPPDVKYVDTRLLPAQRAARAEGKGLWGR